MVVPVSLAFLVRPRAHGSVPPTAGAQRGSPNHFWCCYCSITPVLQLYELISNISPIPYKSYLYCRSIINETMRPFLTDGFRQSKTGRFRLGFLSTGFFWSLFLSQSSRFYSFCAPPRGGWCEGVLLHSRRNRLAALCFAFSPRATARRTFAPASWWLWA